jgi:hypothetical protein
MKEKQRDEVRALMKQGGLGDVPVYQMKFDTKTYALNHERIWNWRQVQ